MLEMRKASEQSLEVHVAFEHLTVLKVDVLPSLLGCFQLEHF